jgi:hypothetical protein
MNRQDNFSLKIKLVALTLMLLGSLAVAHSSGPGAAAHAVGLAKGVPVAAPLMMTGCTTPGFSGASYFNVETNPKGLAVGDFNLDGKPDLVTANLTTNNVSVVLGNGAGGFGSATNFGTGIGPVSVAVGDFNLDGSPDIATANSGSDNVSVLLGNGAGGFGAASDLSVGGRQYSIVVRDFNLDGKPDIAVSLSIAGPPVSNNVSVLLGNGAGGFGAAANFATGAAPISLAAGDFNLDGKPDIAVANFSSNNISVLLGNGAGGFGAKADFGTGSSPQYVTVGDFNLDGKPDLAVANAGSSNVSVLLGNGTGSFGAKTDFGTGTGPGSVAVGDFNLDGSPDIATANTSSNSVSVLLGNGMGSFGAKTDFTAETSPGYMVVGDFNLDGRPDLATANYNSSNVSVLLDTCNGTPCSGTSFAPKTDFGVGTNPVSVAVGDVNMDGKLDLVTANYNSNNVSVRLGAGAGGFGAATNFTVGTNPRAVAVGDFNLDGSPDIVAANFNGNNVSVLPGNGAGGFGAKTDFAVGTNPVSVTMGDFNRDGKPDLAVANFNTNNVSVLAGNGMGSFGPATNFAAGTNPYSVVTGDFNLDGKSDLAVSNFSTGKVSVLYGDGAGGFGARTEFTAGTNPAFVAVGDFNLDGKPDLAVANFNGNSISVLTGNGAGGFGAATNFAMGTGPYSVVVGDFNLDGRHDIATANSGAGNVSVRLGNGTGGFSAASNFAVGTGPYSLAVGDFNLDGKLDIATANNDSSNISVLLSNCTAISGPAFTKTFTPSTIALNGTTALSLTITNNSGSSSLTGVSFSDSLPVGLAVSTPSGLMNTCGGTATATAGSGTVALSGGSIVAGSSCTIAVNVTGTTAGAKKNHATLMTNELGSASASTGTVILNVFAPPTISTNFSTTPIVVGQTSTLNITIANPAGNPGALTGLSFTDPLPSGISAPNSSSSVCSGTVAISSNVITLTGGSLAANASCVIPITVTGAAASVAAYTNTINSISSGNGGTNNTPTTANISVNKAATTAAIIFDTPDPSVMGQSYTVSPTVNVTAPGAAAPTVPTGTITVTDGSQSCSISLPAAPPLTCSLNSTMLGLKNLTATYNGDSNFSASPASTSVPHSVINVPTISKAFGAARIQLNGSTSMTITLNNPAGNVALSGVAFSDSLPAGLVVSTPNGLSNTCGGIVTASAGAGTVGLSIGTLAAGGSCAITVNVTGTTAGVKNNTTGPISWIVNGVGASSNTATLTVVPPPTISKAFGAAKIALNGTTNLTFTLNNPSETVDQSGVAFTDALPAGLVVATPNGLTNTCAGSVTATAGSGAINLSGGSIAAGGTCTIGVNVTGTTGGVKNNTTDAISSTNGGTGATSNTATVTVVQPVTISKAFGASKILLNGTTSLAFTLNNPSAIVTQNGVTFTDNMPAGLVVATPNDLTNTCGGTVTAAAASGTVSLSGGMIAAGGSCTISVSVKAISSGTKVNTTNAVTSTEGGAGSTATATLSVNQPPTISAVPVTQKQGSPSTNSTIANVNDGEDAKNTLSVKINGGASATVNGVTVSGIAVSAAGVATSDVAASCTATTASFTLRVTDSQGDFTESTLTVTVAANTPPVLSFGALQNVFAGNALTVNPVAGPSDNGSVSSIIVQSKGTFTGTVTVNAAGVVSISNAAPSGSHTITIRVTDNCGATTDAAFTLAVSTLTAAIAEPATCKGPGSVVEVTATLTNGAGSSQAASFLASLPAGLPALQGTCSANVGTCNVVNFTTVAWSGTPAGGQAVTIKYKAQVGDQITTDTQLCITSSANVGGGPAGSVQACLTVNCTALAQGAIPDAKSPASDQKAGSVLFYNIYSSDASNYNAQNTRISITNTHLEIKATVHIFFVDGVSCSVADIYICLTPNQTFTILASDIDPGTTGYLIAVAVDDKGCPVNFNFLIGDEFVKFATGHTANLGAQAIAALAGGLPLCNANSMTATLNFDGISYNSVPRTLALDNVPAKGDGNDTMLLLNRFGGNLTTGGLTLGTIAGQIYDDVEIGYNFTLSGGCQLKGSFSNSFPRTSPRFESVIPAGRSGWMKLYSESDIGMFGAVINLNKNSNAQSGAFNQGHNLHKLTLTQAATLTIPVFPPKC